MVDFYSRWQRAIIGDFGTLSKKLFIMVCLKIGQGLLLTGDPHVMVVPPKYFFHAINVQQLIYVSYNFDTVKEIQAILCFAIFGKNSKIAKGPPFLGRGKFFENCQEYIP